MINNEFGTVYSDRVGFYAKRGWFGGGSLEELPMRHVTSVKLEIRRNLIGGLLLLIIGLFCFVAHSVGAIVCGLVFVILAALALWGSPRVRLNTAGGDLRPAAGAPWQRNSAKAFVDAVRAALFTD
jgi:hypothetical protein